MAKLSMTTHMSGRRRGDTAVEQPVFFSADVVIRMEDEDELLKLLRETRERRARIAAAEAAFAAYTDDSGSKQSSTGGARKRSPERTDPSPTRARGQAPKRPRAKRPRIDKPAGTDVFDTWTSEEQFHGLRQIVVMQPATFLHLSTELDPRFVKQESLEWFEHNVPPRPHLMVDVANSNFFVLEHEGRHRAMWAESRGFPYITVALVFTHRAALSAGEFKKLASQRNVQWTDGRAKAYAPFATVRDVPGVSLPVFQF